MADLREEPPVLPTSVPLDGDGAPVRGARESARVANEPDRLAATPKSRARTPLPRLLRNQLHEAVRRVPGHVLFSRHVIEQHRERDGALASALQHVAAQ